MWTEKKYWNIEQSSLRNIEYWEFSTKNIEYWRFEGIPIFWCEGRSCDRLCLVAALVLWPIAPGGRFILMAQINLMAHLHHLAHIHCYGPNSPYGPKRIFARLPFIRWTEFTIRWSEVQKFIMVFRSSDCINFVVQRSQSNIFVLSRSESCRIEQTRIDYWIECTRIQIESTRINSNRFVSIRKKSNISLRIWNRTDSYEFEKS